MSEQSNIERDMALLKQKQEHLEDDLHGTLKEQKETNKSLQSLTTQIARLCDRFDNTNEQLKDTKRLTLENKSQLDKYETTMNIVKAFISALVLGLVGLFYKMFG